MLVPLITPDGLLRSREANAELRTQGQSGAIPRVMARKPSLLGWQQAAEQSRHPLAHGSLRCEPVSNWGGGSSISFPTQPPSTLAPSLNHCKPPQTPLRPIFYQPNGPVVRNPGLILNSRPITLLRPAQVKNPCHFPAAQPPSTSLPHLSPPSFTSRSIPLPDHSFAKKAVGSFFRPGFGHTDPKLTPTRTG